MQLVLCQECSDTWGMEHVQVSGDSHTKALWALSSPHTPPHPKCKGKIPGNHTQKDPLREESCKLEALRNGRQLEAVGQPLALFTWSHSPLCEIPAPQCVFVVLFCKWSTAVWWRTITHRSPAYFHCRSFPASQMSLEKEDYHEEGWFDFQL